MITASVVVHRTRPELLSSLMASLSAEQVERIYVVDNSPDESLREETLKYENTEYRHIPNKGFGNAHNHAIRLAAEAGSEFHLVVNPDVRWDSAVLRPMIEAMKADPLCALAHPRVIYPDGRLQHTCRLLPTPFDVFIRRFVPDFLFRRRRRRYLLPDSVYESEFSPVYVQGSFMLMRTRCVLDVGLFDERFFMYPEDIDLSRRIRARYHTLYCPFVTVIHDHAGASRKPGKMLWIHIVNMIRYFNKWGWFRDSERRRLNSALILLFS